MTKVLVCGGRHYDNYELLCEVLDEVAPNHIIHGGATGADALSDRYARERGIMVTAYPADWSNIEDCPSWSIKRNSAGKQYNPTAGFVRNRKMLTHGKPDFVIAFPGGAGTAHMVRESRNAFVPVRIVT